jgi:hypothetical protein
MLFCNFFTAEYNYLWVLLIKIRNNNRQKYKPNSWITTGIVISCRRKRVLYEEVKKSNNPVLSKYYTDYSRILTAVIKQAKRMNYENQIRNSTNTIRTIWNVIKNEVYKRARKDNIQTLKIEGKKVNIMKTIVEAFNNYFNKITEFTSKSKKTVQIVKLYHQ